MPEELDAMIESGGVASSMSANNLILKSFRSGPFSWTKSAFDKASCRLIVKLSRSRDAPRERPMEVSASQASSTYFRRLASAFGPGSVATTSNPRARYCAAQLAPMTPVPTTAIRLTGLLFDTLLLLLRYFRERNAGEISLSKEQCQLFGPVEPGGIDRARQVGHEHSVAAQIEGDADAFHQMGDQDLGDAIVPGSFDRRPVDRVATRRV